MEYRKQSFSVEDAGIEGLKVINPFFIEDERGFFLKNFEKDIFSGLGLENEIHEEFLSRSVKNVVRGLHFQTAEPQIKIVGAVEGRVFDVAVDLRRDSKTYGKYESCELSGKNHKLFYIPRGFAHGFLVLSDFAIVSYMCIGRYRPDHDTGILWSDPDIGIKWPVDYKDVIASKRDAGLMRFKKYDKING
jgi:dTDP-4-dehydrorhamnose 3,5-epimerase